MDDFPCPHCGELVPATATMCRNCGASADCGWDDEFDASSRVADSGDDFDYDEFVRREFPDHVDAPPDRNRPWLVLLVIAILVSLMLAVF